MPWQEGQVAEAVVTTLLAEAVPAGAGSMA